MARGIKGKPGHEVNVIAAQMRKEWAQDIANGDRTILDITRELPEHRGYLRRIPLITILTQIEGWSRNTAANALIRSGIPADAQAEMLLRNQRLNKVFTELLTTGFQRWVPDINYPPGYPFFGKVEDVLAQANVAEYMPNEALPKGLSKDAEEGEAEERGDDGVDEALDGILGDMDLEYGED